MKKYHAEVIIVETDTDDEGKETVTKKPAINVPISKDQKTWQVVTKKETETSKRETGITPAVMFEGKGLIDSSAKINGKDAKFFFDVKLNLGQAEVLDKYWEAAQDKAPVSVKGVEISGF